MKDNIFISYRRQDSAGFTGRLYDTLARYFGQDRVFMDITDIRGGEDFVKRLDDTLAIAGVFVVVIGKTWLTVTNKEEQRRLDDPDDFVRREVETALDRDIPVLPVLMDGASMPREDELPDTLKELTRYNAVPLSHDRWNNDVIRFAKILEFDVSEPDAKKRFNRLRNGTFFCLVGSVITAVTHAQFFGIDPFFGVEPPSGGVEDSLWFLALQYLTTLNLIGATILLPRLLRYADDSRKIFIWLCLVLTIAGIPLSIIGYELSSAIFSANVLAILNRLTFKPIITFKPK